MQVSYPSKKFAQSAKAALENRENLTLSIPRGWRYALIKRTLAHWPVILTTQYQFPQQAFWNWMACQALLPVFYMMHGLFLQSGYGLRIYIQPKQIRIEYFQ